MKTTTKPSPSTRTRRYASVQDLVKATAADDEQVRDFERRIKDTIIVNALIRSRSAAGMTQSDVAEKMSCTQSAVSKIEHAIDAELTLRDITNYLNATGGRLNLGIGKQPNCIERIKELGICLEEELKALADLSSNNDDAAIRQNITRFFGEAWFNFFNILCDATSKLSVGSEEASSVKLLGMR